MRGGAGQPDYFSGLWPQSLSISHDAADQCAAGAVGAVVSAGAATDPVQTHCPTGGREL